MRRDRKLTEEQVKKMRWMRRTLGIPFRKLGNEFGVSKQTAFNICNQTLYKEICDG
jgi:hypothetical protein